MKKILPFTKSQIEKIAKEYPTPFYVYDERGIRETARNFYSAFEWANKFKNFFAVKATPNPYILKLLKEEGMGVDCSSLAELIMAEKVGFRGEEIMFSSNDTEAIEYKKALELGSIINLDDITHIEYLERNVELPNLLCFRYTPEKIRGGGNALIGNPKEAKYGMTKKQLLQAYEIAKKKGIKRFGLHAMVASNELDRKVFVDSAKMLMDLVVEISKKLNIKFEFINLGGGIGIPYKLDQIPVDMKYISSNIQKIYKEKIVKNNLHPLKIVMENGRVITGPHGYLVTRVLHLKNTYKKYIGVDASMANLMRPGMYGAYHYITAMGKEKKPKTQTYDVTGSLCENNDKFAINRKLPKIEVGDILVIHDTGAHGHAMGFNYNGKLRSAELLLHEDGSVKLIRRAETVDDYLATLDFNGLKGVQ
jgi:diaminopimelate decarboxylase